ncbi:MAG: phospholipase D-like domain-containing protein [Acidimicrobiales bacterium]
MTAGTPHPKALPALTDERSEVISSPLDLLVDAAASSAPATEVLLLSFTLDLGFFELCALGPAQALGARVSVVGDAGGVVHDPRAVRRAGRAYLSGLASCAGAFHPKVVVLASEDHVTAAIGSGNVTLAGWRDNEEIWTVLRAGPDGCPDTLPELARWLANIRGAVRFSRYVSEALGRVSGLLAGFEPTTHGPQLLSSVWGPIIDQLPIGPVDELAVFAPFHDPGANALRRLVERLDPERLVVGVQPGLTVCDGPAVEDLIEKRSGEVVQLDVTRYRHGKLIEVRAGAQRWALTGSPNFSGAALLTGVSAGGNVELALLSDVDETLFPNGTVLGREALRAYAYRPRRSPRPAVVVLGATRTDEGLEVDLVRPLRWAGHVEVSYPESQPDSWERVAELPAGDNRVLVSRGVAGGTRLRVVADSPEGTLESNVVFVIDPQRALRRPGGTSGIRRPTEVFDLFRNTGLAERFIADLENFRAAHVAGAPQPAPAAASRTRREANATASTHGQWEDYLDDCAGRLGHSLLSFALGLPALPDGESGAFSDVIRADWDEDVSPEGDPVGLDEDAAKNVVSQPEAPPHRQLPSLVEQPESVRRRYRTWATRLAEMAPDLGPTERLLALRLVLWIAAAGAWGSPADLGALEAIGSATRALGALPAPPSEAEPAVASLAGVGLSVLRANASRTKSVEENRILARATSAVGYLLSALDDRYVEEYTRLLDRAYGAAVSPVVVADVAFEIIQADPLADALRGLEEHGVFDAHIHGRLLHLPDSCPNPTLMALQAVALAQEAQPVGAWAGTPQNWALVIWQAPDLCVFTTSGLERRKYYRLTGSYTPKTCAYEDRGLDRRFLVKGDPSAKSAALMEAVGLSTPEPPRCP